VASSIVTVHCESRRPACAALGVLVTKANRAFAAKHAMRCVVGAFNDFWLGFRDALDLRDALRLMYRSSWYAKQVLGRFSQGRWDRVVNRFEWVRDAAVHDCRLHLRLDLAFLACGSRCSGSPARAWFACSETQVCQVLA